MSRLSPVRALVAVMLLALTVPGCAGPYPWPQTSGDYGLALFVRNETDREVVILADGVEVLRVARGERIRDRLVLLPSPPPHTLQARTAAGHVLGSLTTAEQAFFGAPGFVNSTRCGDIWVWVGRDVTAEVAPRPPELQDPCE